MSGLVNSTRIYAASLFMLCVLLGISSVVEAKTRLRIGLVLSGGGARGAAHIGVLKVLEELRIPVDDIAGTSMGAIVGGAYAAGLQAATLEEIILNLDWKDLFTDNPGREYFPNRRKQDERKNFAASIGLRDGEILLPQGAVSGQKLDLFLRDLVVGAAAIDDFDQLPIPFRAIATDLVSGQMEIIANGSLASALRSSMSIPGVIAPTEIGNKLFVDGGLVRNLPVDIVREMGADIVIAVNLGTPLLERNSLNSVLGVTVQMIAILTEQNVQTSLAKLGEQDILISPKLGNITAADFLRADEAIALGEQATREVANQLQPLRLDEKSYLAWRQGLQMPVILRQSTVVDEIKISQLQRVSPDKVASLLDLQTDTPFNSAQLRNNLARVQGQGDFERVNYRILEQPSKRILAIDAFEKSWGPDYLRFGVGFNSDFRGNTQLNFIGNYQQTWFNDRGAEWQNEIQLGTSQRFHSEFYQPFSATSAWFVAPYFDFINREFDVFADDQRIAEYEVNAGQLGVDLGLDLAAGGEFRLGLVAGIVDAEPSIGDRSNLASFDNKLSGIRARYWWDSLDSINFPRNGSTGSVDLFAAERALGSDETYKKFEANWLSAFSYADYTVATGVKLGGRIGDDSLPVYDQFALGGFLQLSGLQSEQLRGQYVGFGRLLAYKNVGQFAGAFSGDLYMGGSLEAGNIWDTTDDIGFDDVRISASAFLGIDTLLGPLYLGYGIAEGNEHSLYLFLGRP